MTTHGVRMWLVNTGWTGGGYGEGKRMKLSHTRAMISAALNGELDGVSTQTHPVFNLDVPTSCSGVPSDIWDVRSTWADVDAYDKAARDLATRFAKNFEQFEAPATEEMKAGAPGVVTPQKV